MENIPYLCNDFGLVRSYNVRIDPSSTGLDETKTQFYINYEENFLSDVSSCTCNADFLQQDNADS